MAVKVMVAPAIVKRELEKTALAKTRKSEAREPAKPKRRRSSVYDADGNEVFITLICLKCHKTRPLFQFGLRKMADGAIRNQPWCRTCRSGAGEKPRRGETAEAGDPSVASSSPPPVAAPTAAAAGSEPRRASGAVATEVAAALAAGLGR
jgi:hypothetical protein